MSTTGAVRPRIIVVDDESSIRRLVQMALEDLSQDVPLDLVLCASGQEAMDALQVAPARLLITDLMMPGMSGFELLEHLSEHPELRAGALLVVFSAGLQASAQARLAALPVWRQLSKPVSILTLMECVEDALLSQAPAPASPLAAADGTGSAQPETTVGPPSASDEASAIELNFAGNTALFKAFDAACRAQFGTDLAQIQGAMDRREAPSVHRSAHSLRGVLDTLGHRQAAQASRVIELAAARGDWAAMPDAWATLRAALIRLRADA
jgi:CheY-like chemotaxis protein